MSVAYFIVLDVDDVEFDTFVNGKHVAAVFEELCAFCRLKGLKTMEDFLSQDVSEFLDELELDEFGDSTPEWFAAAHGVDWLQQLLQEIEVAEPDFASKAVIADLTEYQRVLKHASDIGAQWHFELDF